MRIFCKNCDSLVKIDLGSNYSVEGEGLNIDIDNERAEIVSVSVFRLNNNVKSKIRCPRCEENTEKDYYVLTDIERNKIPISEALITEYSNVIEKGNEKEIEYLKERFGVDNIETLPLSKILENMVLRTRR